MSKVKFMCFFLFVPPRSLGRSSSNLEGRWRAAPDISLRDSFFERSRSSRSKVKFVFSVCSPTSPRSLGRSSPNWVGRWRAAPDISSRGLFFKGEGHPGQRSNLCFFCLFLPGPWTDLHQTWREGGGRPRILA